MESNTTGFRLTTAMWMEIPVLNWYKTNMVLPRIWCCPGSNKRPFACKGKRDNYYTTARADSNLLRTLGQKKKWPLTDEIKILILQLQGKIKSFSFEKVSTIIKIKQSCFFYSFFFENKIICFYKNLKNITSLVGYTSKSS